MSTRRAVILGLGGGRRLHAGSRRLADAERCADRSAVALARDGDGLDSDQPSRRDRHARRLDRAASDGILRLHLSVLTSARPH